MLNIMKAETFRLMKKNSIYVMLGIGLFFTIFASLPVENWMMAKMDVQFQSNDSSQQGESDKESESSEDETVQIEKKVGATAFRKYQLDGLMFFFTPVLVIILFTTEFSKKTMSQLVAIYHNRTAILIAKILLLFTFLLLYHFIFAFTMTTLVTIQNGFGSNELIKDIGAILWLVLKQTLYQFSFGMPLVFLSTWLPKESLLFILLFGYNMVQRLVSAYFIFMPPTSESLKFLLSLLPGRYGPQFLENSDGVDLSLLMGAWISITVVIMLSYFGSYLTFQRQQLS